VCLRPGSAVRFSPTRARAVARGRARREGVRARRRPGHLDRPPPRGTCTEGSASKRAHHDRCTAAHRRPVGTARRSAASGPCSGSNRGAGAASRVRGGHRPDHRGAVNGVQARLPTRPDVRRRSQAGPDPLPAGEHWPVGQPYDASQSMLSDFGAMVDKNQHPARCSAQRRRALPSTPWALDRAVNQSRMVGERSALVATGP
jgi:hypothetical protein